VTGISLHIGKKRENLLQSDKQTIYNYIITFITYRFLIFLFLRAKKEHQYD